MGVNWQERKTERAYGMRWRHEGGAGDTQPAPAQQQPWLGWVGWEQLTCRRLS